MHKLWLFKPWEKVIVFMWNNQRIFCRRHHISFPAYFYDWCKKKIPSRIFSNTLYTLCYGRPNKIQHYSSTEYQLRRIESIHVSETSHLLRCDGFPLSLVLFAQEPTFYYCSSCRRYFIQPFLYFTAAYFVVRCTQNVVSGFHHSPILLNAPQQRKRKKIYLLWGSYIIFFLWRYKNRWFFPFSQQKFPTPKKVICRLAFLMLAQFPSISYLFLLFFFYAKKKQLFFLSADLCNLARKVWSVLLVCYHVPLTVMYIILSYSF